MVQSSISIGETDTAGGELSCNTRDRKYLSKSNKINSTAIPEVVGSSLEEQVEDYDYMPDSGDGAMVHHSDSDSSIMNDISTFELERELRQILTRIEGLNVGNIFLKLLILNLLKPLMIPLLFTSLAAH